MSEAVQGLLRAAQSKDLRFLYKFLFLTRARALRLPGIAALFISTALPAQQPGTVLFSTDQTATLAPTRKTEASVPAVTAADHNALTFMAYDLDVHLAPADAAITVRARFTLRNDGQAALSYLPLQLSSALTWENIEVAGSTAVFAQHTIDTDADHTGQANEAVVTLPKPLASGESLAVTAFYSGQIHASAERLERIGAPLTQASQADWDAIAPQLTALRGFGNVLWYPVVAEPVFLGDGAKLFQATGDQRLRQQHATFSLRLSVQYTGDPPDAAIVNGQRLQLAAVSENRDLPAAEAPGVATAEFAVAPLGFRSLSLFVTDRAPTVTEDTLIAAVTDHYDALPQYAAAAALARPLLTEWLGPAPLSQLTLIDHAGQPFEDGAFLVLPMRAGKPATLAPSLVHTLSHAWFLSSQPWLDEGVPQLLSLLWIEQSQGRDAALQALQQAASMLALAEPEIPEGSVTESGQPLTAARDDIYYRTKAAAVLWMLRSLVGDDALKQTLLLYRKDARKDADPQGFETMLAIYSHKDLHWFFEDWVYQDRGLPDLSIVNVTPRELPAKGTKSAGWLISVEVRNSGDAVAEVPVTVRSGTLSATERLRIAARSSASTRILFESTPQEVVVNDGSVPETRTSIHSIQVKPRTQ